MAQFRVRIALEGAQAQDYRRLALKLSFQGFTDTLGARSGGARWALPEGEYVFEGTDADSAETLVERARLVVEQTHPRAQILAHRITDEAFLNLSEI